MKHIVTLVIGLLCIQFAATAGDDDGKRRKKAKDKVEEVAQPVKKKEEPQFKAIDEVTKGCTKMDGFFTMYQDTASGKTYIEIPENKIGEEFIYFKHVMNGVLDAGYVKGSYRDNKIFSINKYYDRIELIEQNTRYYFDPENAISKASNANINEPVVFAEKIVGMRTDTNEAKTPIYLIEADGLFMSETINQLKPSPRPGSSSRFNIGKLNKSKSKYVSIKNYPENTDVTVEYAFDNIYPTVYGSEAVTNPRYTSITVQHSFIAVPDNDFKPRFEDSRVGFFTNRVTDLTSASVTPYRDVIKRWHLKKKDPSAELSEPVEPITWWIENTTPVEIRELILEAGMKWNEAFEKAGFKNAIVLKVQPDDADWDAGDIRYNVLRWTASPQPPFGGYGPSFSNPRTGQILGADVMLEYIYITNRLRYEKIYDLGASASYEEFEELFEDDEHHCSAGMHALYENAFASTVMESMEMSEEQKSVFLEESISRLILHELGHTLGLMHNFCGSTLYTVDEMNNPEIGGKYGVASSVMDYHAINVDINGNQKFGFAINQPGVYDEWAIEYGYSEFATEAEEKAGLAKILAKSTDPQLCFGNDGDDMRSPGKGIDPRFMIGDNSKDPIEFSINKMEIVKKTMPNVKKNVLVDGDSYHALRAAYSSLTGAYGSALNIVTRQIGGVHINRARVGDDVDAKPLTPVSYAEQKRAMNVLARYAFAPSAFQFDNEIIAYLKLQRRGFDLRGAGEDPQMHSRVLSMQKRIFDHVMHENVLERLSDTELYGNQYSVNEVLSDLTAAIFKDDIKTNVNGYRQNLQDEYVTRLGEIMDDKSGYDHRSQAAALSELTKIKSMIGSSQSPNESTKAHRKHIIYSIDNILDVE